LAPRDATGSIPSRPCRPRRRGCRGRRFCRVRHHDAAGRAARTHQRPRPRSWPPCRRDRRREVRGLEGGHGRGEVRGLDPGRHAGEAHGLDPGDRRRGVRYVSKFRRRQARSAAADCDPFRTPWVTPTPKNFTTLSHFSVPSAMSFPKRANPEEVARARPAMHRFVSGPTITKVRVIRINGKAYVSDVRNWGWSGPNSAESCWRFANIRVVTPGFLAI